MNRKELVDGLKKITNSAEIYLAATGEHGERGRARLHSIERGEGFILLVSDDEMAVKRPTQAAAPVPPTEKPMDQLST